VNRQDRIHIGNIIRNAVVFNSSTWALGSMNGDSLISTVTQLFDLLSSRKVDYTLAGGIAMLTYIEGRNTQDIDLIMALPCLKKLPEIKITHQDLYFARGQYEALQIDILLTKNPLFKYVKQHHTTVRHFLERDISSATIEGLLLLKLYALPSLYRQGNFARVGLYENDIATLLHDYQPPLDPLWDVLARHLDESDLQSVKEIVQEIEGRIARFRKSFPENPGNTGE